MREALHKTFADELTETDRKLLRAAESGTGAGPGYEPMAPIIASAPVAAAPTDVWAAISESGNLTNIHPFCERNDVLTWNGADSRDHVHYFSGVHYEREFLAWHDGAGYDLLLGPPQARTALVSWRIEPSTDDAAKEATCRFGIRVVALLRDDVPAAEREHYAEHMIRRPLPSYLESVVRGTAFYAETGTRVKKNQFGPHPIYSP